MLRRFKLGFISVSLRFFVKTALSANRIENVRFLQCLIKFDEDKNFRK